MSKPEDFLNLMKKNDDNLLHQKTQLEKEEEDLPNEKLYSILNSHHQEQINNTLDEAKNQEERIEYFKNKEKIKRYIGAFPKQCQCILKGRNINNLGYQESLNLVEEMKIAIGSETSSLLTDWAGEAYLNGIENFCLTNTDIHCEGLGACSGDPIFKQLMLEASIEYLSTNYVPLYMRIPLYTIKQMYVLHTINTNPEFINEKRKREEEQKQNLSNKKIKK